MNSDPRPLASGWILAERYEIERTLGRGGFGIAYLAKDLVRGDAVVVKELAPPGARRDSNGLLDLAGQGASSHALRHRFLAEAEVLRKFHHPGIPSLRAAFSENGTAYHVTPYLRGSRTLEDRLRREGPLAEEDAREIFVSLLDVLEVVHGAGLLHRDIKPSNILLGPGGEVVLIDFGSARDWIGEVPVTHTVMHTPGYAPPEQLSERALRGPGTDLYGLCATAYHALAGKPPATAGDRLSGIELEPLGALRPDVDRSFTRTIEAGLEPRLADRPQSVDEIREMLSQDAPLFDGEPTLEQIDDLFVRLESFRFDRRACPACEGLLVEPRPLRKGACPVCLEGVVRARNLDEHRCPVCRLGHLERLDNSGPLAICPRCSKGRLTWRKKSLLSAERLADCPECGVHFEAVGGSMRDDQNEDTFDEWRASSHRSAEVWCCTACDAQLDLAEDRRLAQVLPVQGPRYYPEEWARIAAGLAPGAGNAVCDACSADFWVEDGRMTLLDAPRDPRRYAARYLGRSVGIEDARWLGVGKTSGTPGLICDTCGTEFERDGEFQRLAFSAHRALAHHLGEPRLLEDWHRIARGLPTIDQVPQLEDAIEPGLREAYRMGEVSFDQNETAWQGRARWSGEDAYQTLLVNPREISLGGTFRKWRAPLDAILSAQADGDVLTLRISGQADAIEIEVMPLELVAHLRSGNRSVQLDASDLAERLGSGPKRSTPV